MQIKHKLCWIVFLSLSFIFGFSCNHQNQNREAMDSTNYLTTLVDSSIKPGYDFNKFSTGNWLKRNPIPEDESSWGVFQVIPAEILGRIRKINEEAIQSNATAGSAIQKIGDFWLSGMDTFQVENLGISPLSEDLNHIDSIKDMSQFIKQIAYLHSIGVPILFDAGIYQDEKSSSHYKLHFSQGGIGLPSRDYYLENDTRTTNIREAYKVHLQNMFRLLGDSDAVAVTNSSIVMSIENALASASRKLADLRDPYKNYHKFSLKEIQNSYSTINWDLYFTSSGIQKVDSIIVGQPEFFKQLNSILKKESLSNWKIYLRWHLIHKYADYLNEAVASEHFRFYGKILNGKEKQKPRWKRVLQEQESYLGDALGQLYIKKYYSPELKARHEKLVEDIVYAYRDRIKNLEWMQDSTKQKALAKLNAITKKVGYPDKWKDYSSFNISKASYFNNVKQGNIWLREYAIAKLFKPVDKLEWEMTPQTYNAYYNPSNNEIVLPAAAFIVPGIPEDQVDDAILYAYAGGSTVGHELTHAFDDQGSQFDASGNLQDWWTETDKNQFKQRCSKIVTQFNNFVVLDSLYINGEATQGENIADLGGILVGLDAFKKTKQYQDQISIGGYTPLQRYFFGWSISWLGHMRDEMIALRVKIDVHAPPFLRINGPIVNVPEWYDAFQIQASDKMFVKEEDRVKIW